MLAWTEGSSSTLAAAISFGMTPDMTNQRWVAFAQHWVPLLPDRLLTVAPPTPPPSSRQQWLSRDNCCRRTVACLRPLIPDLPSMNNQREMW